MKFENKEIEHLNLNHENKTITYDYLIEIDEEDLKIFSEEWK